MVFSAFCVYWCIASTFLALRCFKISCMIYSLTHQLLGNMLFNFHIFVNFLELFLSLISDFVNWIMKLQSKLQSLHLLIFVCWNSLCSLKENMHSFLLGRYYVTLQFAAVSSPNYHNKESTKRTIYSIVRILIVSMVMFLQSLSVYNFSFNIVVTLSEWFVILYATNIPYNLNTI